MLHESNLTPEQNAAIDRLFEHDETLLIAGLGFGKAIVGLTAARDVLREGVCNRILVLAPLRTAQPTWGSEPAKWEHLGELRVRIACGSQKQRRFMCEGPGNVIVTNFENLDWTLKHYGDTFDGLIIDEISKLSLVGGTLVRKLRHFQKKLT